MGFIKRIFQLSLTKKEVVKSKRFMAVLMIPIFVFQMSSLNLLLLQTAIAEDGEVSEAAVVEEIKEEPTEVEEAPASEELKEDNQPEEEVKPIEIEVKEIKVEEDPEESPIVAESPNVLEEIVPSGIAEVIDEVKKEAPPVLDPKTVEEKNQKDDKGGRITPEAAYDENLEAPVSAPVVEVPKTEDESWRENADGSSSIKVTAGNEYEYKNSGLKIKFTRIDNGTGEITVKEIELTPEQVLELGALSNKAWDITSDMADGTFEYELTLPVVENVDESKIQLVYVEEKEDLNDEGKIKAVEKEDVKVDGEKNELVANGLDHFTVYVVIEADLKLDLNWPSESEWNDYEDGDGHNINDFEDGIYGFNDPSNGGTNVSPAEIDIASGALKTGTNPGSKSSLQYFYDDGSIDGCSDDYIFFRTRLVGNPAAPGGSAAYSQYHWDILFDEDGNGISDFVIDVFGGKTSGSSIAGGDQGTVGVYPNNPGLTTYNPNNFIWIARADESDNTSNYYTQLLREDYDDSLPENDQYWMEVAIPVDANPSVNGAFCNQIDLDGKIFASTSSSNTNPLQKD